jgi:hypothetical protein
MNPPASLRQDHRALTGEKGPGMVFANTPVGLRVAHPRLVWTCDDAVQFHMLQLSLIQSPNERTKAAAGPEVRESGTIARHKRRLVS